MKLCSVKKFPRYGSDFSMFSQMPLSDLKTLTIRKLACPQNQHYG
jgi:hypothetical protein